jgi:dolichyl-phosphate beta-glucosyltransferase
MGAICRLIIPAYCESARLPAYLAELCGAVKAADLPVEICVVEDGSPPAEREALLKSLERLRPEFSLLAPPLLSPVNCGKGASIYAAWDLAEDAEWLAFVDADGAIPAYEVVRVFRLALEKNEGNRAYFASRIKMLGKKIERSTWRHYSGRIFASLVGLMVEPEVYDSQCGFKVVPRALYRKIRPRLQETGFAFDVELLAALRQAGAEVEEVPIDWSDIPGSKIRFFRDSVRMAAALWRIRTRIKKDSV